MCVEGPKKPCFIVYDFSQLSSILTIPLYDNQFQKK